MALRVAFMGTGHFSIPALNALVDAGHDIVAVYTRCPQAAGRRGLSIVKSPVQSEAERLGLSVYTPRTFENVEEQFRFKALSLDVVVVVAYGILLPDFILQTPYQGCFNVHASLLPRWRGAAPIQRAIMAGDDETGIAIMKMDAGLDTGQLVMVKKVKIDPDVTSGILTHSLSLLGARLIVQAMGDLEKGNLVFVSQSEEGITYAHKISKEESRIDWNRSAIDVSRHIRALSPLPGAWCEMEISGKCERVKVLETSLFSKSLIHQECYSSALSIMCKDARILITRLQRAGGKPLYVEEFLRGAVITAVF
ncbi:MAG: methionyl-tRNA formyltransferase [Candidatus Tokpelaia sp. JSC161]|jgi:methionyl-tRNA formyltransferase|nr:MAG: methionyl-tRNA formyltransferase [Candidatus Tokpelaia sp. JSC161]